MAVKRRVGVHQVKVAEALKQNPNNTYTCPQCTKSFRPQGVTNHVRSREKDWCLQNKIRM
jgi:hypothetical protein